MENTDHGRLIALDADVRPEECALEAESCTLGRARSCDVIVGRNIVSRVHARVERDGPRYLLRDAGSANGTYVNGQRIHGPHLLQDQDAIGLGAATPALRFLDPDPTFVPASRLRYDDAAMRFVLEGQPLDLTPSQFRLLMHLYQNAGALCTRESCARAIWGRDYDPGMDAGALDRAVANLRAILRQFDPALDAIQTRRGAGYVLNL